ncbi:LemA family protein [Aerococcaceae bacterium NML191292]|nr:LemA family protein [Aerococcaceae bacterium NML210727]MCW6654485.1 LemA family protein [Aerococcaceae bacterium NML201296]MCW6659113.1 LemA family protein [Aerococcaceae bacterium NML191292]MCW6661986.1 LemA family protein [Aerococcaceae bacterium NML201209]MCW6662446.1 LemA family protein [Aerococcaceae bacterium NML190073]MCW6664435.1 LemA family protein [Aerococcaceae bacterium NML191219]MCW6667107.1 LemA family protein [Aerococcaceae bacterium NML190938]MCW6680064.1 LemA family prote
MPVLVIVGVVAVIGLMWAGIYNSLIQVRTWAEQSFSQIDVQLQRRNDLIPNLVETVKGYAKHESSTLEEVTKARQQLLSLPADASPEQINQMSNLLSSALSRLLAVAESYPELKANQNFLDLQGNLTDTEDKIAKARQLYNSSIGQYNTQVQLFPKNIVAGVHGFAVKPYLEAPAEAREVPKVSF